MPPEGIEHLLKLPHVGQDPLFLIVAYEALVRHVALFHEIGAPWFRSGPFWVHSGTSRAAVAFSTSLLALLVVTCAVICTV